MTRLRSGPFLLALLLALLVFGSGHPTAVLGQNKIFLWEARSDTSTVFLLGSLHLARASLYPLDARIERAFDQSRTLVVEVDAASMGEEQATRFFLSRGTYPPGEGLASHLTPRTLAKLRELGIDIARVDRLKPWFLAVWLQAQEFDRLGFDETYGIDLHFLKKARAAGKSIVELESFEQQIGLFERVSAENPDAFLFYSLQELGNTAHLAEGLVKAWSQGDAQALEMAMFEASWDIPGYERFHTVLFTDRNKTMTGRIQELLSSKGVFFVVVGAGHLVGDQGIVSLLRLQGRRVEQW